MFKQLDEDEALTVEKGVYRVAPVYEGPEGGLYVQARSNKGMVRVRENGATSNPSVRLSRLHRCGPLYKDSFGRLCVTAESGAKLLNDDEVLKIADQS